MPKSINASGIRARDAVRRGGELATTRCSNRPVDSGKWPKVGRRLREQTGCPKPQTAAAVAAAHRVRRRLAAAGGLAARGTHDTLRRRPLYAGCGVRLPDAGRRRALDAARPDTAGARRRDGARGRSRRMGDRVRRAVPQHRPLGCRIRCARLGSQRPRRARRARGGAPVLVPLHRRRCAQPRRTHGDGGGAVVLRPSG